MQIRPHTIKEDDCLMRPKWSEFVVKNNCSDSEQVLEIAKIHIGEKERLISMHSQRSREGGSSFRQCKS